MVYVGLEYLWGSDENSENISEQFTEVKKHWNELHANLKFVWSVSERYTEHSNKK